MPQLHPLHPAKIPRQISRRIHLPDDRENSHKIPERTEKTGNLPAFQTIDLTGHTARRYFIAK